MFHYFVYHRKAFLGYLRFASEQGEKETEANTAHQLSATHIVILPKWYQ